MVHRAPETGNLPGGVPADGPRLVDTRAVSAVPEPTGADVAIIDRTARITPRTHSHDPGARGNDRFAGRCSAPPRAKEPCGSAPWSTGAQRSEPQQRSEMTQTRPATPTDPPDLPRKPLGAGRSPRVTREQLYPVTDTTGDHHNDHRHPAPAATGQVDAATIADRYPIAASASSFIVQTATAEHPLAPLDDSPPVLFPAPGPAGGIGSAGPTRTGRGALLTTTPKSTTGHVTVGNQQLRVDVRAGNRTGTPLVMCCGIGASFEVLQPLVDALDPGIDIIRFDAPGVGGSPVGALPNGFPQLARMLDRLLDELGYDRVDVLGFSWGGALAQQFAVQHAGRCRRLVLISTNTGVLSVPAALSVLAKMVT